VGEAMQARSILISALLFAAGLGIGYYVGHQPGLSDSAASKSVQPGKWRAQITIPGSVELPTDRTAVIKCTFAKTTLFKFGFLNVTRENLTGRSFMVKYTIFGYDEKGRRISEGNDQFLIGKHESVVGQVILESQVSPVSPKFGPVFAIQMFPEE
jgi:hypothetical protein